MTEQITVRENPRMSDEITCIYHGDCADGFTAAWAVYRAIGDVNVRYVPGKYGTPPPDVSGQHVVMVDFSYKRPVIDEMAKSAVSILILDHHKTAEQVLDGIFGVGYECWDDYWDWVCRLRGIVDDEGGGCRVRKLFDMDRSGAGIAWDFFHPSEERPNLVNYVEDRDLWRFDLPGSRDVNAFIAIHAHGFAQWNLLHANTCRGINLAKAAEKGCSIRAAESRNIDQILKSTRRTMKIGGHEVPVANVPHVFSSEAGNIMARGATFPFAACYWDEPDARVFSLRSVEGGADVSEIAAAYGGGGHARAAGFRAAHGWEGD